MGPAALSRPFPAGHECPRSPFPTSGFLHRHPQAEMEVTSIHMFPGPAASEAVSFRGSRNGIKCAKDLLGKGWEGSCRAGGSWSRQAEPQTTVQACHLPRDGGGGQREGRARLLRSSEKVSARVWGPKSNEYHKRRAVLRRHGLLGPLSSCGQSC